MKQIFIHVLVCVIACTVSSNELSDVTTQVTCDDITQVTSQLSHNQFLYVQLFDTSIIKGRFIDLHDDSLFLSYRGDEIVSAVSDIKVIVIKKNNTRGLVLGCSLSGGVIGFGIGTSMASSINANQGDVQQVGGFGAIIGGVIGMSIGMIVGKVTEKQEIIYTRSNEKDGSVNNFKFNIIPDLKGGLLLSATVSF